MRMLLLLAMALVAAASADLSKVLTRKLAESERVLHRLDVVWKNRKRLVPRSVLLTDTTTIEDGIPVGWPVESPTSVFDCRTVLPTSFIARINNVVVACSEFELTRKQMVHIHRERHDATSSLKFHIRIRDNMFNSERDRILEGFQEFFEEDENVAIHIVGDRGSLRTLWLIMNEDTGDLFWSDASESLEGKEGRHHSFEGEHFRVAVVHHVPWVSIQEFSGQERRSFNKLKKKEVVQRQIAKAEGVDIKVLETIADHLNFTYDLYQSSDGEWGSETANGSFTGMIGDIQGGLVQFAITDIAITPRLQEVVSFSVSYFYDSLVFVTKAPARRPIPFVIFSPYSACMWLMIVVSVGALTGVLWLTGKYGAGARGHWTVTCAATVNLQILVSQNVPRMPTGRTGRLLFYVWLPMALVLGAAYGATLVSVLSSAASYDSTLESLDDLAESVADGTTRISIRQGSMQQDLLERATDGPFKLLGSGIDKDQWAKNDSDGLLKLLADPELAYIGTKFSVEYDIHRLGKEKFHRSPKEFHYQEYGIAFRKGFRYLQDFNEAIGGLQSNGLLAKWTKDWVHMEEMYDDLNEGAIDAVKAFALRDIQGAFYVLFMGHMLAFVVLLVERRLHGQSQPPPKTRRPPVIQKSESREALVAHDGPRDGTQYEGRLR